MLALQLIALLAAATTLAWVWQDLSDTLDQAREPELLVLPLADGWDPEDVLTTLAEIEAL